MSIKKICVAAIAALFLLITVFPAAAVTGDISHDTVYQGMIVSRRGWTLSGPKRVCSYLYLNNYPDTPQLIESEHSTRIRATVYFGPNTYTYYLGDVGGLTASLSANSNYTLATKIVFEYYIEHTDPSSPYFSPVYTDTIQ